MKALMVACVMLSTVIAAAQPAPAPAPADPQARAKEFYAQGTNHFNLREYPAAIVAFKEAYRLYSEPLFLFNIAQAYRLSGDCGNAHGFYKTYLRVSPTAADRAKVEKWISELDACAQAATPTTGTPTTGAPTTGAPTTGAPTTGAPTTGTSTIGTTTGTATTGTPPLTDKPLTDKQLTDKPLTDKPLTDKPLADNAVVGPSVGTDNAARTRKLKLAGLVTLGGGALVMIGGGVFSFRATGAASDVEALCANGCDGAEIADADRRGRSAQRTAANLYVAGGLIAAIGGGLYLYATLTGREQAVTVTPTAGGAMATAAFEF